MAYLSRQPFIKNYLGEKRYERCGYAMTQCILCARCVMLDKGNCTCQLDDKRTVKQALTVHECKKYRLGPMHSVRSRSQRRMTFSDKGLVILE